MLVELKLLIHLLRNPASMTLGMAMLVSPSTSTARWITVKLCTDIHGAEDES